MSKNFEIKNGDIFDIGQTINGVDKFVWIGGKWCYYHPEIDREYEYGQNELTNLIYSEILSYGEDSDCQWIGNVFSLLPN
jgi:hypothetical protein